MYSDRLLDEKVVISFQLPLALALPLLGFSSMQVWVREAVKGWRKESYKQLAIEKKNQTNGYGRQKKPGRICRWQKC